MTSATQTQDLPSLGVTCGDANCKEGLHCFRHTPKTPHDERGRCVECKIELIDWTRHHNRDLSDSAALFKALRHELIRHAFWHVPIPDRVRQLALRPSREVLEKRTSKAVATALIPAHLNFREGWQTPFPHNEDARIFHYGQHATATCCRRCLEYWHGIDRNRHLTDTELDYCTQLVMLYVEERLAELPRK
jgi:hypothetical protein